MKIEATRTTLELAIVALKALTIRTHRLGSLERRVARAAELHAQGDQAHAAAEELRRAVDRAGV
jgi:hypothetical protein